MRGSTSKPLHQIPIYDESRGKYFLEWMIACHLTTNRAAMLWAGDLYPHLKGAICRIWNFNQMVEDYDVQRENHSQTAS